MEAAPPSTFHFRSNPCSVRPIHWAQQSLSTRLVLVAGTPRHHLYSCLPAHIKAAFLSSLTETPSVAAVVAAGTCGSRQETDALAQDCAASLTCPRAFLRWAPPLRDWHLRQCRWRDWCRGGSRGISQRRENGPGWYFMLLFCVATRCESRFAEIKGLHRLWLFLSQYWLKSFQLPYFTLKRS